MLQLNDHRKRTLAVTFKAPSLGLFYWRDVVPTDDNEEQLRKAVEADDTFAIAKALREGMDPDIRLMLAELVGDTETALEILAQRKDQP